MRAVVHSRVDGEYAVGAELAPPRGLTLNERDRNWLLEQGATSSLAEIEKATLRMVALRCSTNPRSRHAAANSRSLLRVPHPIAQSPTALVPTEVLPFWTSVGSVGTSSMSAIDAWRISSTVTPPAVVQVPVLAARRDVRA
jgi:hypothetical protein